jgi:hypothetical protein
MTSGFAETSRRRNQHHKSPENDLSKLFATYTSRHARPLNLGRQCQSPARTWRTTQINDPYLQQRFTMARRRTKNRSRKIAEAADVKKDSNQENQSSESAPSCDQKKTKSNAIAASKDQAHADRVAKTLANVERLLSQANENVPTDVSDWLEASLQKTHNRLSDQLENFAHSFEKRFDELQRTISESLDSERIAQINNQGAEPTKGASKADASDEPESEWESRKRKMYAEYGEELPATMKKSENTVDPSDVDTANGDSCEGDELASLQESLHDSIESLDEVQAEEIEELRSQLTEKLREAEVELSINRAKLDQRKAELERRQTELDRREKSLNSKYANVNGAPQKMGVLDRLTRHLGVRKQADSL